MESLLAPRTPERDTGFSTNKTQYAGATMIENSGYLRVTVATTSATVEYVRSFPSSKEGENNSVAACYTLQGYAATAVDAASGR